ncbi:5'/3'-nucleotidase SurE [Erythrobacter sp. HL-111]|uniref:5'/3'-nucleotidase SurE n=1 Tax=Erythrobacter sp. HL-111 TaxID=1798193 RepID=UPI0006DA97E4|nr:5'/3'-nucleotidase SurE [Erythrobacter sp. HL-111]KPP88199.1 MAG: 5'-nucleotidase [Erythrobacteraceae bacterium HL-111]SDS95280.1 5'-nucleotidase [Erythrobacter sp. HL-111]
MNRILAIAAGAALALVPESLLARNIVLGNDDGLTSNLVALYEALSEAGHDVIVAVPCTNQSGMGAALDIARPLVPLSEPCLNDAAQPGDPGAGAMTREDLPAGDFHYVDGTPLMALMHGLDVVARERWGGAPDLVLSGPNEGQNVGAIVLSSGTVSVAQFAALHGLPAIALSAGANTESETLDNPLSDEVAGRVLDLVEALDAAAGDGPLLPRGLALNVNFPDRLEGAEWRETRIGTYNAYRVGFAANLAETASATMRAMAAARGMEIPPLPGVSFDMNTEQPAADQLGDESVVYRRHVAVSPMRAGYDPAGAPEVDLADLLGGLLAPLREAAE